MILFSVAIVLVHAVLAVHAGNPFAKTRQADDIEALCADKPVALLTISELEHLSELVGGSTCSANVKAAIPDLVALIKQTQNDLCAQESIDKLREFYAKYLDTSAKENKRRENLPASLKKFALAYGMRMSSLCKQRMVDVLTTRGQDVLYTREFKTIRALANERSPVAKMLEGLTGPDEILLPGDLAPYIKDKSANQETDDTMYVQSATSPHVKRMQALCTSRLAPIYKPLIGPIVQLTNMGFNYKDEPLKCDMDCPVVATQLGRWSRVVFLCESLNNIRMVDVVPKREDPNGNQAVRLLTKEEAAAIEGKSLDSGDLPEVAESKYNPVRLQDQSIYNKGDKRLKKAIKKFSTSKSEEEKIAKRMMGKGVSMLKTQIKRFNVGLVMSTSYKAVVHRIRTGQNLKPNDEMIKLLDSAIGHESEYLDRPEDFDDKWNLNDLGFEVGMNIVSALVGVIILSVVGMVIAFIVFQSIAISHVAG